MRLYIWHLVGFAGAINSGFAADAVFFELSGESSLYHGFAAPQEPCGARGHRSGALEGTFALLISEQKYDNFQGQIVDVDFSADMDGVLYRMVGTGVYSEFTGHGGSGMALSLIVLDPGPWEVLLDSGLEGKNGKVFPGMEYFLREGDDTFPHGDCLFLSIVAVPLRNDVFFRRGDVCGDGQRDISDCISLLSYLFLSGERPSCVDAADADDDGQVGLTDAILLLTYLFKGGERVAVPFSFCGIDATEDALDCEGQNGCMSE